MSLCAQFLRPIRSCSSLARKFSATAEAVRIVEEPFQAFRTIENDPSKHTSDHLNRFYTLPNESRDQLFRYGGLPKKYALQVDTFMECAILVRSPVVELISYLRETDYTKPANRYVLYGKIGTGKSIAIMHLIHYALATKKIIMHVPWARNWFAYPKEVAASQTKPGYYDLPLDAAAWLLHFKHQNGPLISQLDLKTSNDYQWSPRESTKTGAPLMELVDLGINRVKYACDIIYALTEELKILSTAGKCNTFVAIDGFNAFYAEKAKIKHDNGKWLSPMNVSLTSAFLNMTKFDWCNGAIVVTVDPLAHLLEDCGKSAGLPKEMLGIKGFEHLDPFLPIEIRDYTAPEFYTVMDYYKDRKWLRNVTDEGLRELELLTARNPYTTMIRTSSL